MNIGVLASHRGTILQAIVDACESGRLPARVSVVISNNSRSGAAERAQTHGIPFRHLSGHTHPDPAALDGAIEDALVEHECDVVFLAGYMKQLGPAVLRRFSGRLLNTHPALLPKFGGQGMYGARVHEAVLASKEKVTGVSVHLVEHEYDTGPVVTQAEVPVLSGDTVDTLSARVAEAEYLLVVETLKRVAMGTLALPGVQRAGYRTFE